ncbi:MAG: hypothetical protein NTW67_00215 [Candidatus Woesearchaeota archaeon]|nr:hypothetical protein [Candidatus Woesearchaeota archaeon]
MRRLLPLLVLAFLVVACTGGETKGAVSMTSPFVGGAQGLVIGFQDYRAEVFDGGQDPFNVIVKLENKGEALVPKDNVRVRITGINPVEFGKSEQLLTLLAPDDVIETRKTETGVLSGPLVFTEFVGLNHAGRISGASAQFTLRADVCYLYRTQAVGKLCVRDNLLTPRAGGICEINENKPVYNSGAPVQISDFKESARAKDKLGFTFDIKNVGVGSVFQRNTFCDRTNRQSENRVYVIVQSGLSGLLCTGLEGGDIMAEGFVTLYGGSKTISCTQAVSSRSDYEQVIGVEVVYDYEQTVQDSLLVKSAGE